MMTNRARKLGIDIDGIKKRRSEVQYERTKDDMMQSMAQTEIDMEPVCIHTQLNTNKVEPMASFASPITARLISCTLIISWPS
jgi:hypothetical protein